MVLTKLKKIPEYLLYLFIFSLPWQTRWIFKSAELNGGFWEYGSLSLFAFDLVFFALVVFAFLQHSQLKELIKERSLKLALLLLSVLIAIAFISGLMAQDNLLAFYWAFRFLAGGILVILCLSLPLRLSRLVTVFWLTGLIQAGLAIYQFLVQRIPANKYLGLAEQLPSRLGTPVIEVNGQRILRVFGSFSHPNILAAFLLLVIFILFFWYLGQEKNSWLVNLKTYFSLVLLIGALYLTFSKNARLVFFFALIFFSLWFLLTKTNQAKQLRLKLLTLWLLIIIVVVPLVIIRPTYFRSQFTSTARLEKISTEKRLTGYDQAFKLLTKNWYTGVGVGNYTLAVYNQIDSQLPVWDYQPVHNIYLLIACELSIFGLGVFLLFLWEVVKDFFHSPTLVSGERGFALRMPEMADAPGVSSGSASLPKLNWWPGIIILIALLGLFDHYFFSLPASFWLLWLFVGLWLRTKATSNL